MFFVRRFKWAKNHGLYTLAENPATADLPEGLPKGEETYAYTAAEVVRLLFRLIHREIRPSLPLLTVVACGLVNFVPFNGKTIAQAKEGKATIHVKRSYWKGHFTAPKTEQAADMAKLGAFFAQLVENFRAYCGGVDSGLIFSGKTAPGKTAKPINLENLARRVLAPALNRCAVCHQRKVDHGPRVEHKFERDESFRIGTAFSLSAGIQPTAIGADRRLPEVASLMLRHSGTQVTGGIADSKTAARTGARLQLNAWSRSTMNGKKQQMFWSGACC